MKKPPVLIGLIPSVTIHNRRPAAVSGHGRTNIPRPPLRTTSPTSQDADPQMGIQLRAKQTQQMPHSAPLIKWYNCLGRTLLSVLMVSWHVFREKKLSGELDFTDIKATGKPSTYSRSPSCTSTLCVPQDCEQKNSFQHIDIFSQKQYDCTAV